MAGKTIVTAVVKELEKRTTTECAYDNYVYPDDGSSYSNDDSDD
ncbi:MAG: hypothetical protein UU64_C0002G0115 [candidate division WWE3 bacterium GW2011_GWF2_41_45]|uniref:Uncharacterized protein n=1 Tax=candidate division WWE3 bacterium GW2011_GWC2_41_23 TaxID=1619123 RepID=A0A0G0VV34_UNCKA|nr:MAG: hypothetical protein UU55_C0001G0003 [candidate division WWE3 bacterium GW2011_GWC2_41_23]KKS10713.1 MAG: hypothetical protein UU64_C0002G0115 [candidate division WWE3 bacterium GW2011_GWF2_41_45]KKS12276.1 MAG: hypothetical protein UU68_C0002G0002 [candidate division WWE3 bacterium GW2011_GWF1_41_53]KKS20349.1 MAG: hypothetical protein UU79_C0001G0003 [candidate division WWE3 bacterium GW2011_GWE1_41_72]KKS28745.1 MAG: hypothetical protein UU90_C0018G0003 [candidate division WWE3 bacte